MRIVARSHDDEFFPRSRSGCGHFPNGRCHAINIFQGIGEPRAFAILQSDRNFAGQFLKNGAQPFSRGRLTVKPVDVWGENYQDRRNRAQSLHALDHVAAADLLNEFLEKSKRELLGDHVGHEKCAALRFADFVQLRGEFCLYLRPREIT